MPVIDYKPPTELHAVAVKAFQLLERGGGKLGPKELAEITSDLEALYDRITDLADAVHSLGALMLYAEQQGAADAALVLRKLIHHTKPVFDSFSEAVRGEIQDEAQAARASLSAFRGEDYELRAKHVGSAPPPGSVPLSAILPNPATRRPPMKPGRW